MPTVPYDDRKLAPPLSITNQLHSMFGTTGGTLNDYRPYLKEQDDKFEQYKKDEDAKNEQYQAEQKKHYEDMTPEEYRDEIKSHAEDNVMRPNVWRREDYFKIWKEEKEKLDKGITIPTFQMSPKQLREKGYK